MSLLIGILATVLLVANISINCIPLFVMGLLRLLVRLLGLQKLDARLAVWMDRLIDSWVVVNRALFAMFKLTRVELETINTQALSRDQWFMVISNHQSWTDILILQIYLFERIPPLKFFTKRQLLWVPFLGQAMWFLDFPYVRRMSRAQIEQNPHLLAVDRQATALACNKFRKHPTSVLNFLEGTRFTAEKHAAQTARFKHLLNPKAGGLSQVLWGLREEIDQLVDVTITYPEGVPTFWEFMQGECPVVHMRIDCLDVPQALKTNEDDDARRTVAASWVEELWQAKDVRLAIDGAARVRD